MYSLGVLDTSGDVCQSWLDPLFPGIPLLGAGSSEEQQLSPRQNEGPCANYRKGWASLQPQGEPLTPFWAWPRAPSPAPCPQPRPLPWLTPAPRSPLHRAGRPLCVGCSSPAWAAAKSWRWAWHRAASRSIRLLYVQQSCAIHYLPGPAVTWSLDMSSQAPLLDGWDRVSLVLVSLPGTEEALVSACGWPSEPPTSPHALQPMVPLGTSAPKPSRTVQRRLRRPRLPPPPGSCGLGWHRPTWEREGAVGRHDSHLRDLVLRRQGVRAWQRTRTSRAKATRCRIYAAGRREEQTGQPVGSGGQGTGS